MIVLLISFSLLLLPNSSSLIRRLRGTVPFDPDAINNAKDITKGWYGGSSADPNNPRHLHLMKASGHNTYINSLCIMHSQIFGNKGELISRVQVFFSNGETDGPYPGPYNPSKSNEICYKVSPGSCIIKVEGREKKDTKESNGYITALKFYSSDGTASDYIGEDSIAGGDRFIAVPQTPSCLNSIGVKTDFVVHGIRFDWLDVSFEYEYKFKFTNEWDAIYSCPGCTPYTREVTRGITFKNEESEATERSTLTKQTNSEKWETSFTTSAKYWIVSGEASTSWSGTNEITQQEVESIANSMTRTVQRNEQIKEIYGCDKTYLYQYKTYVTQNHINSFFAANDVLKYEINDNHFVCSDGPKPKCLPGYCSDASCQSCLPST